MYTLSRFILALVLAFPTVVTAEEFAFSDVPFLHPNAEAIEYVKAEGIVEGYADGTFRPDATINRAEFTKIVTVASNGSLPTQGASRCFKDVIGNEWYAATVCWAKGYGAIGGYPDGTFRPGANISFAEAAKIIVGIHDPNGMSPVPLNEPWYRPFVQYLGEHGAIPTSIKRFDQNITRGEMAEMIFRLDTRNNDKPTQTYEEIVTWDDTVVFHNDEFPVTFSYPARWSDEVQSDSSARWYIYLGPICRGCAEGGDAETMGVMAVDRNETLDAIEDLRQRAKESSSSVRIEKDVMMNGNRVFLWSDSGICGTRHAYVVGNRITVSVGGFCVADNAETSAILDTIVSSMRENPTFMPWR